MAKLTEKQLHLYEWIKAFIAKHDYSPTITEITDAYGFSSPAPIQSRLRYLRDKGYITWQPGKNRTIAILM